MPRFEPPGLGRRAEAPAGYTMTIAEAAVRLGVVPATLARWRSVGVGPSWWQGPHRSSPIFYRPAEIAAVKKAKEQHLKTEPKREVAARIERASSRTRKNRRTRR